MNKTAFLLVFILSFSFQAQPQDYWEWTDPVALTDSVSDNCNPFIHTISNDIVYIFWDKYVDTSSTEIWMDNILDDDPAEVILSDPGIQYSNPKILRGYFTPDTMFLLFYETNQDLNKDIYFKAYLSDDTWGPSTAYATTPFDDVQLTVERDMFYDNQANVRRILCWVSNGDLWGKNLMFQDGNYFFADPVKIDSSGCNSPSVGWYEYQQSVAYNKADSSSTYIKRAACNTISGEWYDPEPYYDSIPAMNPTGASWYDYPCWTVYSDTSWRIMIKEPYYSQYTVYDIHGQEPFDPAALGVAIAVKSWYPEAWIAVAYPDNGMNEIYMTEEWGNGIFTNFSNSGTNNRNPGFFPGESYNSYCWYDYLLWESYRNGHWQIWSSKVIQCAGSLEEPGPEEEFISAYPNPFTHESTLTFTLDSRSDVVIEVYDNSGVKVDEIASQNMDQGEHQLRWKAETLPAGIYIIKLIAGNKTYSTKVIKIE